MEKKETDEIDLYDLTVKTIRLFKKNVWLFIVLVLSGMVCAILYYRSLPIVFSARMILLSEIVTPPYSNVIVENLNGPIIAGNPGELARLLQLPEEDAAQIDHITASSIDQQRDSVFLVSVEVRDKRILPKLQVGILNYLRTNEFLAKRSLQRKEFNESMINRIGKEIRSLDSLKKNKLLQGRMNGSYPSASFDPGTVAFKLIELHNEQLHYKNALASGDGVQVVAGFTTHAKTGKIKLSSALILGFLGGLLSGIAFLSIRWVISLAKE